jgi:hypothetical protein
VRDYTRSHKKQVGEAEGFTSRGVHHLVHHFLGQKALGCGYYT